MFDSIYFWKEYLIQIYVNIFLEGILEIYFWRIFVSIYFWKEYLIQIYFSLRQKSSCFEWLYKEDLYPSFIYQFNNIGLSL